MNRFLLIILTLSLHFMANAQRLTGKITNEKGEAMPYSTVYIEPLRQSAICDFMGNYEFNDIPAGNYTLRASYIGYQTLSKDVSVTAAGSVCDFNLKESVITLDEYFVLPNGMDFRKYVITKLDKSIKPLKKRLSHYECTTTATLEKHIDLSTLKKRRTIHFALSLLGWGKNFNTLVKYNDLKVTMQENVVFNKGKITSTPLKILSVTPQLSSSEAKSFCNKDWFLNDNSYDRFYDEVHKKIKMLNSKKNKRIITYHGSYEEGGKTIYILRYGNTQVDIVDGCWQIRRMRYKSKSRTINFEFRELSPGVYLPITGHAEYYINWEGYPKGTVKMSMTFRYRNVRK